MLLKGSEEYKKAQQVANNLSKLAETNRVYNNSYFNIAYEDFGRAIAAVKRIDCFAAQVAATVDKGMNPYNRCVAYISSKQAWIIACAIVENNIETKL